MAAGRELKIHNMEPAVWRCDGEMGCAVQGTGRMESMCVDLVRESAV